MNTKIEIHDNDTVNTGTYSIWFKYNKQLHRIILSENESDSLLNLRQKEDFFIGKSFKFKILESDFKTLINKL